MDSKTTRDNQRRTFLKSSVAGLFSLLTYPAIGSDVFSSTSKLEEIGSKDDVFKTLRKQLLLDKKLIYLNTGSLGPSPRQIVDLVNNTSRELESNPVSKNWGELGNKMENVRSIAAEFFNVGIDEIVLTRNTTEGLSMVGSTLKLNPGDEILTTNHEHGGGEVGLEYLARKNKAVIKKIEMPLPTRSKSEIVDLISKSISSKTRVLMLSHVVTITGLRMPIEEIANITSDKGILFIVDGAQAPGMINVDLGNLGADIYATSGHKWLLGPKETGIVFISKNVQEIIDPVFTASGYASYSASSGTRNVANIIGLGEALRLHMKIGKEIIEEQVLKLSNYCLERVKELNGLEVISPDPDDISSGMVSVKLVNANNREIFETLRNDNIVVKLLPKYNALRLSAHIFNTKDDIDKLTEKLELFLP